MTVAASKRQEVCVSLGLLGNCPKHFGKRCLVLKNRCGSLVLGNIYVACLKNNNKSTPHPPQTTKQNKTNKRKKAAKKKGSITPHLCHNTCSAPQILVPWDWGGTLASCGSHHSDLTDLPGEAAMVLILTSTPQSRNYTERSFGAVSVSVVRLLKVCKDSDLTVLQEPSGGWPQQAPQVYSCSMAQAGGSEERRQPGPSTGCSQGSGTLLAPCLGSWWQLPRHSERV